MTVNIPVQERNATCIGSLLAWRVQCTSCKSIKNRPFCLYDGGVAMVATMQ